MRRARVEKRSCARAGRVVPTGAAALKASVVVLAPTREMGWHSTREREELLVALRGRMDVEWRPVPHRARRVRLAAGQCLFLPAHTLHRVVNRSALDARYLYVTAPVPTLKA